jgi:general secretion pathway protein A
VQLDDAPANVAEDPPGYERHFGLAESPFALTSNPRFLFESTSHQAALKEIAYGLPRREPIIVVTGAIGTGKTTLCRIVAERQGPRTVVATISSPPDNVDDLLRQILDGFGVLTDDTSQVVQASHYGLLRTLQQFLTSLVPLDAQAIILFDEAQHLRPDMLEQIRLLSNLDADGRDSRKLLQIILVGQPELDDLLSREDLRQMSQRISRRHRLGPLQPTEVAAYVDRRLTVARGDQHAGELPQFTASAMRAIASLSTGVPRVINTLCDRALESAWADETHTIDTATIVRAARSLDIDVPLTVRVRVKRRYAQMTVGASILLGAVLLWTVRDSAFSLITRRTAAPTEAARTTAPAAARPGAVATPVVPPPVIPPPGIAQPGAQPPVLAADTLPPDPKTPETLAAARFLIVVSSFRTRDRATQVAADIVALGLPAFVRTSSDWQQVVVGPYTSRQDAAGAQTRLAIAHIADTKITESVAETITLPPPTEGRAVEPPDRGVAQTGDAPIDDVLRRASELARQPNVRALQQIRDQIARRQDAATGATEAAALKSTLDQLDRYLDEARRRQLVEDGRQLGARP